MCVYVCFQLSPGYAYYRDVCGMEHTVNMHVSRSRRYILNTKQYNHVCYNSHKEKSTFITATLHMYMYVCAVLVGVLVQPVLVWSTNTTVALSVSSVGQ